MTEIRCPTDNRLSMVLSDDFDGDLSNRCRACKTDFAVPLGGTLLTDKLLCECGKWVASGTIRAGWIQVLCPRDRVLARITPERAVHVGLVREEEPKYARYDQRPRPHNLKRPRGMRGTGGRGTSQGSRVKQQQAKLLAAIQERWESLRIDKLHRKAEMAVGLRFDVFSRDGFRCRYCGRGPTQGVLLEADHVVPRAVGGPDVLDNLVTACWDCNRGKSAKPVDASRMTA